jgi:hypothetical protein
MKASTVALMTLATLSARAETSLEWVEMVPASVGNWRTQPRLAQDTFFEVPVSRLEAAESKLSQAAAVAVQRDAFAYFGRPKFRCSTSNQPYLVRASFMNGGNGKFEIRWLNSALLVSHESLGSGGARKRSVLLVCLPREPTAVFGYVESDQ